MERADGPCGVLYCEGYLCCRKEGFKTLLGSFDSKYEVLSRKYFSQTVLPVLYSKTSEAVSNKLEDIIEKGYFTATTDL